jgi:hypothetical protein
VSATNVAVRRWTDDVAGGQRDAVSAGMRLERSRSPEGARKAVQLLPDGALPPCLRTLRPGVAALGSARCGSYA